MMEIWHHNHDFVLIADTALHVHNVVLLLARNKNNFNYEDNERR